MLLTMNPAPDVFSSKVTQADDGKELFQREKKQKRKRENETEEEEKKTKLTDTSVPAVMPESNQYWSPLQPEAQKNPIPWEKINPAQFNEWYEIGIPQFPETIRTRTNKDTGLTENVKSSPFMMVIRKGTGGNTDPTKQGTPLKLFLQDVRSCFPFVPGHAPNVPMEDTLNFQMSFDPINPTAMEARGFFFLRDRFFEEKMKELNKNFAYNKMLAGKSFSKCIIEGKMKTPIQLEREEKSKKNSGQAVLPNFPDSVRFQVPQGKDKKFNYTLYREGKNVELIAKENPEEALYIRRFLESKTFPRYQCDVTISADRITQSGKTLYFKDYLKAMNLEHEIPPYDVDTQDNLPAFRRHS